MTIKIEPIIIQIIPIGRYFYIRVLSIYPLYCIEFNIESAVVQNAIIITAIYISIKM